MSKRKKFVFTSVVLSLGFLGVQLLEEYRMIVIAILGLLTIILFGWSLRGNISFNATLSVFVLPLFYTIGVGLFWFLLPSNLVFTQIPISILYGLGIYALITTSNILTVSATRTIALIRAARGVGFVITLFTLFLIYDAIISIRVNIVYNMLLIFALSIPLYYQGFWSIKLNKNILDKDLLGLTLISSLVMGEMAVVLYFWPVSVVVGSTFLTIACYLLLGLGQAKLEGRLFSQTIREYLLIGGFVFLIMLSFTSWR
jgi:hypothetical protein